MILNKINKYKGFRLFAFAGSLAFTLTLSSCRETFTPLDIPEDVLSPGEVTDFVGMPLDGAINLSWKAPVDFDHRGYELTYTPGGETPIELGKVKSYEVLGLENGTEYAFTLKSFDIVGNVSEGVTTYAVPEVPSGLLSINEAFETGIPEGWVAYSVSSDANWTNVDNGDGNMVMECNNYMQSEAANDWLITPALELEAGNTAVLNFDYSINYADEDGFGLKVMVSTDYTGSGDPSLASWTVLPSGVDNGLDPNYDGDKELRAASAVALSAYSGNVHVAFVYTSSLGAAVQARIDNVSIVETPIILEEQFEEGIPSAWLAYSLGSNADWTNVDNGDGNMVMECNNYGESEAAIDWLISPIMELEAGNAAKLYFDYSINYADEAGYGLEVMVSADYTGAGDPTAATWTVLPAGIDNGMDPNYDGDKPLRAANSVSLSEYSGNVYVAFVYTSSLGAAVQARIDNVVVK